MSTAVQHADMLSDFAEFLLTQPTADEIWRWHPSEQVQQRIADLVERKKEEEPLDEDELRELDSAVRQEMFLRELKARLPLRKTPKS